MGWTADMVRSHTFDDFIAIWNGFRIERDPPVEDVMTKEDLRALTNRFGLRRRSIRDKAQPIPPEVAARFKR